MTGFPRSPVLTKGTLVAFRLPNPVPTVIPFQFNPETLARKIDARAADGENGEQTFRLSGPPIETITLEAQFDAADALETEDDVVVAQGLTPRLAALEVLLYPEYITSVANMVLAGLGTIEILPTKAPFTVFIWGKNRILPVVLSSLSIGEEAYDPDLNPIRAKVSMELKVLSTADLKQAHPGHAMFLAHQTIKEAMAQVGNAKSLGRVLGSDVNIL